mmetsp:Transcript_123514/g.308651  ORF Transcript_123514/g.308651 Transcript_123514/m.308651 type:complete len:630 (+) Transcript_123514:45-1934(+)
MAERLEKQLAQLREDTSYMLQAQNAALQQCITSWSTRHQQLLQEILALHDSGTLLTAKTDCDAGSCDAGSCLESPKFDRLSSPCMSESRCSSPLPLAQCQDGGIVAAEETDAQQTPPASAEQALGASVGSGGSEALLAARAAGTRRAESMTWSTSGGRTSGVYSSTNGGSDSIWSHGPKHALQAIVESAPVHVFTGALIVMTIVMIGCETDYVAEHGESTNIFFTAQIILNAFFIIDVVMRLIAWGACELFCHSEDRAWNIIDLVLVLLSICDLFSQLLNLSQLGAIAVFRVVRVCRLLRLVRVIKLLRMVAYVQEIRKIFLLLAASAKTLIWSLLSVLLIMYIFAVLFTESTTGYLQSTARENFTAVELQLWLDFGTVGRSIYSLYTAISGGRNWGTFVDPLIEVGPFHAGLFIAFISFSFFGVLNIVTSVFVECAMQSTQRHRDLLVEEKKAFELGHLKHMRTIFREIDIDQSGSVEYLELKQRLADNNALRDYFRALELNATDTLTLFELLDQDESGSLDIDEFCDGCMRLKGDARAFDINFMIQQSRKANKRVNRWMSESSHKFSDLSLSISNLQSFLRSILHKDETVGEAVDGNEVGAGETWNPDCWEQKDAGNHDAPDDALLK